MFYPYAVAHCNMMIAHNDREAVNMGKPERWREIARSEATDWRVRLERALIAQVS